MTVVPPGPRPAGLTWTVLTTQRTALRLWLAFVVLMAALMTALYMMGEEVNRTNPCSVGGGDFPPCSSLDAVLPAYTTWMGFGSTVVAWLPVVVAAFAGGALVGRQLENGTAALAWTQSVTPVRWLVARLAVPALLLCTGTLLLTLMFRWVWTSGDSAVLNEWYWSDVFRATGPVTTAYVLLALAVGAVAALLTRRTLPALGLAASVMLAVHALGEVYRFELWPPVVWKGPQAASFPNSFRQGEAGLITASGETLPGASCDSDHPQDFADCLNTHDAVGAFASGHPVSHYWPIQLVETGIVLALTALLTVAAFQLLRRRLP